jgi:hypothetical protein
MGSHHSVPEPRSRDASQNVIMCYQRLTSMRFVLKPTTEARYFLAPW